MRNPEFSATINLLGSDEPCLDPDKLTELALDIGEVIRKYGATDHVRERFIRWTQEHSAWCVERADFERRRDEYGEKIHNDPKLQDESVPPDSNCVFEYVSWRCGVDGKQHLLRKYGWVPRELSRANFPEPSYPLPMCSGKATLNEKYAAIAAIFDAGSKGVEKIDPYGDYPEIVKMDERKWYVRWLAHYDSCPRKTFETKAEAEAFAASPYRGLPKTVKVEDLEEVIAWDVRSSAYRELVACVGQLPRSDEGHLRVWLGDVGRDLENTRVKPLASAVKQEEAGDDPHAPYFPSRAFCTVSVNAIRAAANRGRINKITEKGGQNLYSWPDAHKLYPNHVPKTPPIPDVAREKPIKPIKT